MGQFDQSLMRGVIQVCRTGGIELEAGAVRQLETTPFASGGGEVAGPLLPVVCVLGQPGCRTQQQQAGEHLQGLPAAYAQGNGWRGVQVVRGAWYGARIAAQVTLGAHCFIGARSEIGEGGWLAPRVTLYHDVRIGKRVVIQSGAVLGGEGFGFAPYQGKWHRIAQLGSVKIGHDVRIGSNCSIDRGALDDTILEDGVIIDNLVQIAHNVKIGSNTAIAAKSAIAGSSIIGKNCVLAGAVGVVGHIQIVDNVTITAMSMVTKSILEEGTYSSGTVVMPNSQWKRAAVRLKQLADVPLTKLVKQIDHMQAQIESIESTLKSRK